MTGDINAKDETIMEKVMTIISDYLKSTETLTKALLEQLDLNITKKKTVQVFRYCHLLDSLGESRSILNK